MKGFAFVLLMLLSGCSSTTAGQYAEIKTSDGTFTAYTDGSFKAEFRIPRGEMCYAEFDTVTFTGKPSQATAVSPAWGVFDTILSATAYLVGQNN